MIRWSPAPVLQFPFAGSQCKVGKGLLRMCCRLISCPSRHLLCVATSYDLHLPASKHQHMVYQTSLPLLTAQGLLRLAECPRHICGCCKRYGQSLAMHQGYSGTIWCGLPGLSGFARETENGRQNSNFGKRMPCSSIKDQLGTAGS